MLMLAPVALRANTYYVRGSHAITVTHSTTQIKITLVRTSGRDSAVVTPHLTNTRSSDFSILDNKPVFEFSRYAFDSVSTIVVYFYTTKYRDTAEAILRIPLGTSTDTIRFHGTDANVQQPMPSGSCYTLGEWGTVLGGADSNSSNRKWDFSQDFQEYPGQVTIAKGVSVQWVHLRLIGSPAWYIRPMPTPHVRDSLGFGTAYPQELYTTGGGHMIGYQSRNIEFDTALLICEAVGNCAQRDTLVLYMHDAMPTHIWQKLAVGDHDLGVVQVGDTVCKAIPIVNTIGMTISIDSIDVQAYMTSNDDWHWQLPTLPLTLYIGDTTYVNICYHAMQHDQMPPYGPTTLIRFGVNYSDSAHLMGRITFDATSQTPPSLTVDADTVVVNDVMVGGYTDLMFNVYNNTDSVKVGQKIKPWLWSEQLVAFDEWHVTSPTDSMSLHLIDTIPITVRFAPYETGTTTVLLQLANGADRTHARSYFYPMYIIGRAIDSSADSLGLFTAPEQSVLTLQTQSSVTTRTFHFTNNGTGNLIVTGVHLRNGTHFQITGTVPVSLPDTMAHGDDLAVTVQFNGDTIGFYRDSLEITTQGSSFQLSPPILFDLQAIRTPAAAVHAELEEVLDIILQPSPARKELTATVPTAHSTLFEIYDLLGHKLISERRSSGQWNASLESVPSGTYILRATGLDANGRSFQASKRFIKE